jgi:hypothetical protein
MYGSMAKYNSTACSATRTCANYDKVVEAYNKLGHVKQKVTSPDLRKLPSRDMSIYMQTEALRNVLNENYKLMIEDKMKEEAKRRKGKKNRSSKRHSL